MRCVDGCLECVEVYERTDEVCDGVDNDCSGVVDDGDPEVMGTPPPAYAATLVDHSHPLSLEPGEIGDVWMEFENVGTETWTARQIWIQSLTATGGQPSSLHDVEGWAAFDVPAVLEHDTPPGSMARFTFTIQAPENPGEDITESFRLYGPQAEPIRCPRPEVEIQLRVRGGGGDPDPVSGDGGTTAGDPAMEGGCTCRAAPSQRPFPMGLLLLFLLIGIFLTRR
jgi:MYXO-CTERM domain-containing protein